MPPAAHLEYAPPKSWEQFEELCADLFQVMWQDPALVRHGRAGQRQRGVDIVARHGAFYPVGLQCKRRAQWPEKTLSIGDIDAEIADALSFEPALHTFYLLTTAPDDVKLQAHVRRINDRHRAAGLFTVVLLGWSELARRVTLYPEIAAKHFGSPGHPAGAPAPLLGTWYTRAGRLEAEPDEFSLAVREIIQDLRDWPAGRIVVRQRESDALLVSLQTLPDRPADPEQRKRRLALRQELQRHNDRENRIGRGLRLMLSEAPAATYLNQVLDPATELPIILRAFIEHELDPRSAIIAPDHHPLRIAPPGHAHPPHPHYPVYLPPAALAAILALERSRIERYGQPLTDTIDELPATVRAGWALPAAIRCLLGRLERGETLESLRSAGALELGLWRVCR